MKTRRAFLQTASCFAAGSLFLPDLLKANTKAVKNDVGIQLYSV